MFDLLKQHIKVRIGNLNTLESNAKTIVTGIFNDRTLLFIRHLSERLLSDHNVRQYPDVYEFAFWCRSSGISLMQAKYNDIKLRKGRGIVLHFAPSNIPVHFAYLMAIGLLSGNKTIIRISSKVFDQAEFILHHLNVLISADFSDFSEKILILQYEHNQAITDYLSALSNARTIWGGNESIRNIQKSIIKPGGIDISFADRHSICIINANEYLRSTEKEIVSAGFYNDTFTFDQNSCSAPFLIVWKGLMEDVAAAQKVFWKSIETISKKKYNIQPGQIIYKFETLCEIAAFMPIQVTAFLENSVMRARLMHIDASVNKLRCRHGLFLEYICNDLSEISPLCDENLQTITYFGFDREYLLNFFQNQHSSGNERIVKIGRALEFSVQWDGTDLIQALSKKITL